MVDQDRPVLVVGGTGALGGQVVGALRARGKPVRALVRRGSDAGALEGKEVEVVRGDMMDPASLGPALDGVDALVTSAVGYTRRRKGDTSLTDTVGNRNLADAAKNEGVRRFVFTGILSAHEAPSVPHFWHKKLAEDYLEGIGVPFVSLRPGAFLDQVMRLMGSGIAKGRLLSIGSPAVPLVKVMRHGSDGARSTALRGRGALPSRGCERRRRGGRADRHRLEPPALDGGGGPDLLGRFGA